MKTKYVYLQVSRGSKLPIMLIVTASKYLSYLFIYKCMHIIRDGSEKKLK